jgi:cellulose biosynthesis protein BcsQ
MKRVQISFWSNMHGQGAVSATTAVLASEIAVKTAYKTLVVHNQIQLSALESYFLIPRGYADYYERGIKNEGIDALFRLMRNGRLSPDMIPDYTLSLLKNHRLDILLGTSKKEMPTSEEEDIFIRILDLARTYYDFVLIDAHSGLNQKNTLMILNSSDIIVLCINQNRFLLDQLLDLRKTLSDFPEKKIVYVITRFQKLSSMTPGNIAKKYDMKKEKIFIIPENARFLDALNNGRVFEFVSYYQKAKSREEKVFMDSISVLCQYITEGCAKQCPG